MNNEIPIDKNKSYDLNDTVKVTLTEKGAEILNGYYEKLLADFPMVRTKRVHEYKPGDTFETQFWCLFERFGSFIDVAATKPFKHLIFVD